MASSSSKYPLGQNRHVAEQPQPASKPVITPLFIPCLQPLKLTSGSNSSNNKRAVLAPLASPNKRISAKRALKCSRQLFATNPPTRAAALDFWLEQMEKAVCRPEGHEEQKEAADA